eukprot:7840189-Pyramimonas_sp.AAC.1
MKWTCPGPCSTPASETCIGEAIGDHRLRAEGEEPLVIYGDGSGGERSGDIWYVRCGWAWVRFNLGADGERHLAAGKRGPPYQAQDRATT